MPQRPSSPMQVRHGIPCIQLIKSILSLKLSQLPMQLSGARSQAQKLFNRLFKRLTRTAKMTSTTTTTETLQEAVPFVAPPSPPEDVNNKELPEKPYYDVEFNYRLDPRDGGDEVIWGGTVGLMRRKYETRTVRINNERGNEHNFNLDTHGFAWVKHKTSVTEFADYLAIRQGPYYGEVAEMLKRV